MILLLLATSLVAQQPAARPRARDLGVPFDGTPGPLNAITDVAGVEVGQVTLISGSGPLVVGKGPVRTGVTAILPRGKGAGDDPVMAGWFTLNGNGEMTGTTWLEETGFLRGPVMITNTYSVGVVRDAVVGWLVRQGLDWDWSLPIVAETWDGTLNDIEGFHVTREDAFRALDSARGGPVAEGNVGGGTGMICYEFKGGTGTASRKLPAKLGGWTMGALVQANFGRRYQLSIAGVPVGQRLHQGAFYTNGENPLAEQGSLIVVLATDAPLLPHQLRRVAKRATLGMARTGALGGNGSGDIFLAFSTANAVAGKASERGVLSVEALANENLDLLFAAAVYATEEAIINALVAAETMTGRAGLTVEALPHDGLMKVMAEYKRI